MHRQQYIQLYLMTVFEQSVYKVKDKSCDYQFQFLTKTYTEQQN